MMRPIMRYHGAKWKLAPWIISNMPIHKVYVEPFGGSAAVLLQKDRLPAEVYNDLDSGIVSIFRVLQDPRKAKRLKHRLYFTLFSRAEFDRCYEPAMDDVDMAAKAIILSFFGFGTDSITRKHRTGFRAKMSDVRALPSQHWRSWWDGVDGFIDRIRGVLVENCDAADLFKRYDTPGTLFYCDPPYVVSTRSSLQGRTIATHGYRCELTDVEHAALAHQLEGLQGMVMISGYRSDLYDDLYSGWMRIDRPTMADGARARTESLWFNEAAASRRPQPFLHGHNEHSQGVAG